MKLKVTLLLVFQIPRDFHHLDCELFDFQAIAVVDINLVQHHHQL